MGLVTSACFTDLKTFFMKFFQGVHIFAFGSQMKNFYCVFNRAIGISSIEACCVYFELVSSVFTACVCSL
jgi:hypothetical protein